LSTVDVSTNPERVDDGERQDDNNDCEAAQDDETGEATPPLARRGQRIS